MSVASIFACFFAVHALFAGEDVSQTLCTQEQLSPYSFPLRLAVEDIVSMLRRDAGIKVHFEFESFTFKEGGLSASAIVEMYGTQPFSALSENQRHLLDYAKSCVREGKGNVVIDYRKVYVDLNKEDLLDIAKLISRLEGTHVYRVARFKDALIIYPGNVVYKRIGHFKGNFKSTMEAFVALSPELRERNLNFTVCSTGPRSPNYKELFNDDLRDDLQMDIENEDFRLFLSEFAEALGPNVSWVIGGYANGRHMSFVER